MNKTTTTSDVQRLYEEWKHSVLRGRPDRFAKQKAYLAAVKAVAA